MLTNAFGAGESGQRLELMSIERRNAGPRDVVIDVLFCGVCHSDVHTIRNEWGGTTYPCVPGHEIVGRVSAVGAKVRKFDVADLVGVGCIVDSCRRCISCEEGEEQYCSGSGAVGTYNAPDRALGGYTFGGYSKQVVVDQDFVLRIRHKEEELPAVAPLLCAGISTYSPLRHWKIGPGKKVGIVGLGGLGHMAVKFAVAMGAYVVVFTTSPDKQRDAVRLGAHDAVLWRDQRHMDVHKGSFDFILNTVAAAHDLDPYIAALARDGTMVLIGVPGQPHKFPPVHRLVVGRRSIAGSLIGGIAETQEMLDFCHKHGILADVETIPMADINDAYERLLRGDVKYRFVIDMGSLPEAAHLAEVAVRQDIPNLVTAAIS